MNTVESLTRRGQYSIQADARTGPSTPRHPTHYMAYMLPLVSCSASEQAPASSCYVPRRRSMTEEAFQAMRSYWDAFRGAANTTNRKKACHMVNLGPLPPPPRPGNSLSLSLSPVLPCFPFSPSFFPATGESLPALTFPALTLPSQTKLGRACLHQIRRRLVHEAAHVILLSKYNGNQQLQQVACTY